MLICIALIVLSSVALVVGAILLRAEGAQEALQPSTLVEKTAGELLLEQVEFAPLPTENGYTHLLPEKPMISAVPHAITKKMANGLPETVTCISRCGSTFVAKVLDIVEQGDKTVVRIQKRGHRNAHPFWRPLTA